MFNAYINDIVLIVKAGIHVHGYMELSFIFHCKFVLRTLVFMIFFLIIVSGEELLLTELIFNGAFNDLSVEQCVAMLSCFVFQEKVRHMYCVVDIMCYMYFLFHAD